MSKFYSWDINHKNDVVFKELDTAEYSYESENYFQRFAESISIHPSTNGIYSVPSKIYTEKPRSNHNILSIIKERNYNTHMEEWSDRSDNFYYTLEPRVSFIDDDYEPICSTRILISTEAFLEKYLNDVHIDTTTASGKYFFKGKHISPKLFIRKHLEKSMEPSNYFDVDPTTKKSLFVDYLKKQDLPKLNNILLLNKKKTVKTKATAAKRVKESIWDSL